MLNPVLKIALIEPSVAYAAELGQILAEALVDFSFEILGGPTGVDFLLLDENAPSPISLLESPTILFRRNPDGVYTAQAFRGPAPTIRERNLTFPSPLVNAMQQLAAAAVAERSESKRQTAMCIKSCFSSFVNFAFQKPSS